MTFSSLKQTSPTDPRIPDLISPLPAVAGRQENKHTAWPGSYLRVERRRALAGGTNGSTPPKPRAAAYGFGGGMPVTPSQPQGMAGRVRAALLQRRRRGGYDRVPMTM